MRGRRALVIALAGAAMAAAVVALAHVTDELPGPLGMVARLQARVISQVVPPRVDRAARLTGLTEPEGEAVAGLSRRLDGVVVWSSNRSGNHELYLLDLRTRGVRPLTRHPNVDFFSRLSPDGRQVVFLRSQREWVSFRETTAWDILLVGVDGAGERVIARGGYHPTWTADGRAIVFLRQGKVWRHDLSTGAAAVLLDGHPEAGITEYGDAELGPDGRRLAFYERGARAGIAILDLASAALAPLPGVQACQPTWTPDGSAVVWVEAEGRGGTRIMTGSPEGRGRRPLVDLPGTHSHEYFPKVSSDGRWLIWGASAGGHEHDRADYEIFVWEIGTPADQAIRLTWHPGNDQWPDLWVRPGLATPASVPRG